MATRIAPSETVQMLWPTPLWNGAVALTGSDDIDHPDRVREALQIGLAQTLSTGGTETSSIEVRIQRTTLHSETRIPIHSSRAELCAWIWIEEQGQPETEESGSIHLHDPRAGASLTVLPGLPWGRPIVLMPRVGTAVIWPGWLSWTLLPLSADHRIEAAYCEIQSSADHAEQLLKQS